MAKDDRQELVSLSEAPGPGSKTLTINGGFYDDRLIVVFRVDEVSGLALFVLGWHLVCHTDYRRGSRIQGGHQAEFRYPNVGRTSLAPVTLSLC